jgi:valyl-tRNA synthetase
MIELTKFFDYKTKEQAIAQKLKDAGIYKFENKGASFKIDTPPPTVSGSLHMGHVFSYVQADIIARYKRMMDFDVFYPIGFDDNGLPTERLVEKKTGKKVGKNATKQEFIAECWKVVNEAEKEFEEVFTKIGLSVDFNTKYQTISAKTAEISQSSFVDLWNKGLVYQKLAPVYWDVVDKTALAQADIEDKEKEGLQITYKALIEAEKDVFEQVQIMTTRAEMIPACVCVLYHPSDDRYSKFVGKTVLIPCGGDNYKLEVPLIADEDVIKDKGTGLVMCCAFGDIQDKVWIERHNLWSKIKTWQCVLTGLDTQNLISDNGLLNAPLFKKEDGRQMKVEEGRKFIIEKLLSARLIAGSGLDMTFEDAISSPKVAINKVHHAVKCGERSGEPVEILFKKQWYLSVLPFKRDLMEVIKKVNFHPSHFKVRLEKWIEGLNQDWCISRDRFFGIQIPVRKFEFQDCVSRETLINIKNDFCVDTFNNIIAKAGGKIKDGYFEIEEDNLANVMEGEEYLSCEDGFIINGLDLEIKNIGINKYEVLVNRNTDGVLTELLKEVGLTFDGGDFILKDVELKKLQGLIEEKKELLLDIGIEDLIIKTEELVFDTWFTSSLSPQIAFGDLMQTPVFDLRPQAHEIIRTWAFYTIVKTYLHSLELKAVDKKPDARRTFNSREFFRFKENPNIIPWKNVMLSGWCLASDKTKMSKSKGNIINPLDLISTKGIDAIRLWCASSPLGNDTYYSEEFIDLGTKFTNKLWNAFKFFALKEDTLEEKAEIIEEFDKWILAKLSIVLEDYKKQMDVFEYSKAKEVLDTFFWKDLCDNYLEIIKVRYYGLEATIYKENPPLNPESVILKQQSCLKTLQIVLRGMLKLYAPFAPFITEELSQMFFKESIHKKGSLFRFNLPKFELTDASLKAISVIESIRKYKADNSLSMNSTIESASIEITNDIKQYEEDLKNVTGVKEFKK